MKKTACIIILLVATSAFALPLAITITSPDPPAITIIPPTTPGITITGSSSTGITVNYPLNTSVAVIHTGPQGPAGADGTGGGAVFHNLSSYARLRQQATFTGISAGQINATDIPFVTSSIASHNALGSSHSGHFVAANPHIDSKSRTEFSIYSASRQADINARAILRQKATFRNMSLLGNLYATSTVLYPAAVSMINPAGTIGFPGYATNITSGSLETGSVYGTKLYDRVASGFSPFSTIIKQSKKPIPVACGTDIATAIFDGAQGIQGFRGYSGATGPRGFRGYSGATGPRGFRGYSGAQGNAATIAVGSVETLTPSTPAYVVNVGTYDAAIFNIGIPKGEDGSATITQAQVLAELDNQSTGVLEMRGTNDTDDKIKMLYSTGEVSIYITSSGLLFAKNKAGKLVWGWDNTSNVMKFSNWSTGSSRVNMTIDGKGQIHQYATNGTTLIFESHTTGRVKTYYKATGKLMEHTEPDGKRTLYRPDGIRARMINYTSGVTAF